MLRTALLGAAVLATVATLQPATTVMPLSTGARIVFVHPASWSASVDGPTVGPTATFETKGAHDFKVLVTAIHRANGKPESQAELEQMVREQGEKTLATATQKSVTLVRVDGREAKGFLYHFTDRSPEKGPGDYRELNQGAVLLGPYLLSVTILTHSGDQATVSDAIKVLAGATYQEGSR
jgi:hypothetical protein